MVYLHKCACLCNGFAMKRMIFLLFFHLKMLRVQTKNVCFGDFAEFRQSSEKLLVWPFKCTGGKEMFKMSFCFVFIWKAIFTCVAG